MLELINEPNDIKDIKEDRLYRLASEIRRFMIENVSKTGGHLASNLGVVELTIALHRVYDLPKDKIIWDVGHQSYTHKILTGRKDEFANLRKEGGISGFPRRDESPCDSFDTGHSSNSISAGVGYVKARELLEDDYSVVSVIGDGALTGGMAYEALNNAAMLKSNFVIVLNDNEMSISKSIGGMADYLSEIRTSNHYNDLKDDVSSALKNIPGIGDKLVERIKKTKNSLKQLFIPGMLFENMGITYLGPIDGHNIRQLIKNLRDAKRVPGPVIVHVITEKGRGYKPAFDNPAKFHGISPFDIKTGEAVKKHEITYADAFSEKLCELASENKKIVAVTASMKDGTGLGKFDMKFPERTFDVGIAEGHAVTFTASLALGGMIPVTAIYSAFLQRGFDQLLTDVCMQNVHAVFAVDRAGMVGEDGKSHQGLFDLSYLSMLPNMTVMAPKNANELGKMLEFAINAEGPVAIRYPRGSAFTGLSDFDKEIELGKAEVIQKGNKAAILAIGTAIETALETAKKLEDAGIYATIVNMRFVKPIDEQLLIELSKEHELFVTIEENVKNGGFGEKVLEAVSRNNLDTRVYIAAVDDVFVSHGTAVQQRKNTGIDAESVTAKILELL